MGIAGNESYYVIVSHDCDGFHELEVKPETISQCTGHKDKNDELIWEHDIVRVIYNGEEFIRVVIFDESELDFKGTNGKEEYKSNFNYLLCNEEVEVIGNIFDNEKLLNDFNNREV